MPDEALAAHPGTSEHPPTRAGARIRSAAQRTGVPLGVGLLLGWSPGGPETSSSEGSSERAGRRPDTTHGGAETGERPHAALPAARSRELGAGTLGRDVRRTGSGAEHGDLLVMDAGCRAQPTTPSQHLPTLGDTRQEQAACDEPHAHRGVERDAPADDCARTAPKHRTFVHPFTEADLARSGQAMLTVQDEKGTHHLPQCERRGTGRAEEPVLTSPTVYLVAPRCRCLADNVQAEEVAAELDVLAEAKEALAAADEALTKDLTSLTSLEAVTAAHAWTRYALGLTACPEDAVLTDQFTAAEEELEERHARLNHVLAGPEARRLVETTLNRVAKTGYLTGSDWRPARNAEQVEAFPGSPFARHAISSMAYDAWIRAHAEGRAARAAALDAACRLDLAPLQVTLNAELGTEHAPVPPGPVLEDLVSDLVAEWEERAAAPDPEGEVLCFLAPDSLPGDSFIRALAETHHVATRLDPAEPVVAARVPAALSAALAKYPLPVRTRPGSGPDLPTWILHVEAARDEDTPDVLETALALWDPYSSGPDHSLPQVLAAARAACK